MVRAYFDPGGAFQMPSTRSLEAASRVLAAARAAGVLVAHSGVRYAADQAVTQTLSIRSSSGAVRTIDTKHRISTSTLIPWRD